MGKADGETEEDESSPSPGTRAFIARRHAFEEASAAADAVEAARRERELQRQHAEYHNPFAILAGFVVLALLLGGFVFILDRFRSDPWFADCPTAETGSCR
jgi:hypothetical protein